MFFTLQYVLESAFCLALLYAFYHLVLRRETFFQLNRLYLILAAMLACVLPALNIRLERPAPVPAVLPAPAPTAPVTLPAPAAYDLPVLVERVQVVPRGVSRALEQPLWSVTLGDVLTAFYLAVAAVLLLRLLVQIVRLALFIRRCRRHVREGVVVAEGQADMPPASFFGFVFWQPGTTDAAEQRLLFEHEMVHVRQWHSLDLILIELLIALQWFNPLLYMYRRGLRAVHEYIADEYVVRRTRQRYAYARLLVRRQTAPTGNGYQPGLVNTFHSLIQQRLIMLAKNPSRPLSRAKYLFVLPLAAALMLLFSFRLVEKLPGAAPLRAAIREAGSFAARLAEVTITPDGLAENPGPSPYMFYWGVIQARFVYAPDEDAYFAEIHTSKEEFRAALQREPRLWNGQSLEQHLQFEIAGRAIQSDYNRPEVYESQIKTILEWANAPDLGDYLHITNIALPNGKKGEIQVFLTAQKPKWINPVREIYPSDEDAALWESHIRHFSWDGDRLFRSEERFITVGRLWEYLSANPSLLYTNGREKTPARWSVALFNERGVVIAPAHDAAAALTLEQVRQRLLDAQEQVRPGAKVWLGAWDALEMPAAEPGEVLDTIVTFDPVTYKETMTVVRRPAPTVELREKLDTVITFDPVTYQETVTVVRRSASDRIIGVNRHLDLVSFHLVNDDDPRLALKDSEKRDFDFEWGSYTHRMPNRYARAYTRGDYPGQVYADLAYESLNFSYTKKQLLELLRQPARLLENNQTLADFNFTLDYNGYGVLVENGRVPADFLDKLERELKPRDVLKITGMQARTGADRHIVGTRGQFESENKNLEISVVRQIDLIKSGSIQVVRITAPAGAVNQYVESAGGKPRLWVQYGDVDLTPTTLTFEVRSDDPKPALAPSDRAASAAAAPLKPIGISVSPNPARERAVVQLNLPQAGTGQLTVTDSAGKQRFSITTDFPEGNTPFNLPMNYLQGAGVYFIKIEMPYGHAFAKLVIE